MKNKGAVIKERFQNLNPRERLSGWSQSAFSDPLFRVFLGSWLISLLISAGYIFMNFNNLPSEIPLFYSRIWGQTQLAGAYFIYLPTLGGFLLGIFDFSLSISFHPRDRVFAYLLAGVSSLLSILVLVTSLNIVNLMK